MWPLRHTCFTLPGKARRVREDVPAEGLLLEWGLKGRVGGELLKAEASSWSSSQVTTAPGMAVKYIQEATVRKNGWGRAGPPPPRAHLRSEARW